jgi:peptidylprolyl isomerase
METRASHQRNQKAERHEHRVSWSFISFQGGFMTKAKKGDRVRVHYTGKFDDGNVFDSSKDEKPLQFVIGNGNVIKGFEEAVIGMHTGEQKTIEIPAEKAYGPHVDAKVLHVERERIPSHIEPHVGQRLKLEHPDGHSDVCRVTDVTDARVTLDANHPLAGRDLTFEIQLVEIL